MTLARGVREASEPRDSERPTIERPVIERTDVERPAVERPAVEQPAVERAAIERPVIDRADVERPAVERTDVEPRVVEPRTLSAPLAEATFGSGGAEPYASALRGGGDRRLYLSEVGSGLGGAEAATMDPARWSARADAADLSLLDAVRGPVIDIGCGPGRMVRAALDRGLDALGIDVSVAALEVAAESGIPVLHRSVFDALPREGEWQTVLLVDGNIGIGGDVSALLARCLELLTHDGELVIEVNRAADLDVSYRGLLTDTHGHESASFPWADIGLDGLVDRASALGLATVDEWMLDSRVFCRLARRCRAEELSRRS